jgi:hypothetical protein
MRSGRSLGATASIAVIIALSLAPLGGSPAVGATKHPKVVVATGGVTCTKITGSITYHPAVRHVGTSAETQVFSFKASHCTTTHSNVKHVTGGSVTAVLHRPTNSCVDLLSSEPSAGTGQWTPKTIHSTSATFSGYTPVTNSHGDAGFTIPNTGGTARVKGSFAGANHGATSRATIYINMTTSQFVAACKSAAGLSRQSIISGVARFS